MMGDLETGKTSAELVRLSWRRRERTVILCHPDNREWFLNSLAAATVEPARDPAWLTIGIEVLFSNAAPKRAVRQEWRPPADPFITYEESDRGWLEALGFGETVLIDDGPAVYGISPLAAAIQPLKSAADVMRLAFPPESSSGEMSRDLG